MSEPLTLHLSPNQRAWGRFRRNRPAVLGAWYLAILLAVVVLWPLLLAAGGHFAADHDPDRVSNLQFCPPDRVHWFGTDIHGRDLFSRLLYGAQISLLVGIVGTGVSLVIGVLWGAVAGYVGGRMDNFMMRIVDVLYSLPSLIFVSVFMTTAGESM